jgi:predicted DCC family thiol-disulfide oxidoreductase YuxK
VNLPARIRPAHPVLLYDDHCKFCRASVAFVHGWDRGTRLDFLPLSDPLAASLLSPMSEAARMESMHVVQPDGTISSAGQALLSLCAELPAASLLARASSAAAPVAAGTKALYDALSAIRGSLAQIVPQRDPVRRWRGPSPQSSGTSAE